MKLLLLLTIFAISTSGFSQGWMSESGGLTTRLSDVVFVNYQTGYICGFEGKILKTTSSGASWFEQNVSSNSDLYGIAAYSGFGGLSADTLFVCGEGGVILRTLNGGQNWTNLPSGTSSDLMSIYSITGLSGVNVVACGENGVIRISTNGGSTWSAGSSMPNQTLNSIIFINPLSGFTVGNNGTLAYSANEGQFGVRPTPNTDDLFDITTISNSFDLYISTEAGNVINTTNLGTSWNILNTGVNTPLYTIDQLGSKLWTAGANGNIRYSTNNGANWTGQNSGTSFALRSLFMLDSVTGWVVGDNGVILSTQNGGWVGITQSNSEIPERFSLSQNYPNPFNPSTKIQFDVPKSSYVKLAVYDMLGREVSSLVNQQLQAGTYEYEFNAATLNSGIYFYKISTDNFSEIKKMILIK
jgi:photosystem II stability/assembly factor-like uncharacterized protein